MKVLHVTASLSPQWGGPVTVISNLTQELAKRNIFSSVFAATGRRVGTNPIQIPNVPTSTFLTSAPAVIWTGYAPTMGAALVREARHVDLLHLHELWHYPHFAGYRAARRVGKPYVVTVHGNLDPWALEQSSWKKRLYWILAQRSTLQRAAYIQAITREEQEHIRAQGIGTPTVLIPNGIDVTEFKSLPPKEEFQRRYPALDGKETILFLGRLHPKKGLDILTKAFAEIAHTRSNVHLVIVGPDEVGYRSKMQQELQNRGAASMATFTGPLGGRDKLAAFSAADIFVLPSYSEVLGLTVIEAMACGLPVIISRQCYFPEVAEANAGLVIDTDPTQLAQALLRLIGEPQLRRDMGKRGQALVSQRYTWDKVADQMQQLYQMALDTARVRVDTT